MSIIQTNPNHTCKRPLFHLQKKNKCFQYQNHILHASMTPPYKNYPSLVITYQMIHPQSSRPINITQWVLTIDPSTLYSPHHPQATKAIHQNDSAAWTTNMIWGEINMIKKTWYEEKHDMSKKTWYEEKKTWYEETQTCKKQWHIRKTTCWRPNSATSDAALAMSGRYLN